MQKIRFKNWEEHQSYRKDRGTPPWIKVYRNLFSKPKWVILTDKQKGQLVSLWVLAADDDGHIPSDTTMLMKLCMLDEAPDLSVFDQWFEDDVTNLTPTCQPDDANMSPQKREEEKRIEENHTNVCLEQNAQAIEQAKEVEKNEKARAKRIERAFPQCQGARDFQNHIDNEWWKYAAEQGHQPDSAAEQLYEFWEHFTSPDCQRPTKKSWFSAWQRWCRNARVQRPIVKHSESASIRDKIVARRYSKS